MYVDGDLYLPDTICKESNESNFIAMDKKGEGMGLVALPHQLFLPPLGKFAGVPGGVGPVGLSCDPVTDTTVYMASFF